jgi:benzodiazapine receptor
MQLGPLFINMKKFLRLIFAIIICHAAGIVGSFFTVSEIDSWYSFLEKPSFSPPNWIFAPVWLTLYTLMGVTLYLIWQNKKIRTLFLLHLVFNAAWSILFFGFHWVLFAFVDIIILTGMIALLIVLSQRVNRKVPYLLLPYFLWVCFASVLNFYLYVLN